MTQTYRTIWTEGNGTWHLMKKGNGIIKVEDNLFDLAIAQGAETIEEETIELDGKTAKNLGLDWDYEEEFIDLVQQTWGDFADEFRAENDWVTDEYFDVINPVLAAGDIVIECDDDRADKLDAVRVKIIRDACWKFYAERWEA
jgi:hypothetical protein